MSAQNVGDWTCDHFLNNRRVCEDALQGDLLELPSVNSCRLHDLKDGQLVRYRGMIQDMYNPEFYFENYEVMNSEGTKTVKNGMYKDTAVCKEDENILLDSPNNKSSERQTFVVISIPGLNDWAKESPQCKMITESSSRNSVKRPLDECDDEPMDTSEPAKKKEKDGENLGQDDRKTGFLDENLMNFPVPIDDGRACIVKVYNEDNSFKLNQVVDIIGFISLDPTAHRVCDSEEFETDTEMQVHNPPTSLIPRLHAIKIIHSRENISKLNGPLQITNELLKPEITTKIEGIRTELHLMFSQVLFGDDLAADYIIANLLSTVYLRRDDLCLGNYPLNISNFSVEKFGNFPRNLYEILTKLLPKSHYFLCTLDNLNDESLIPKKDYESNRLTSGILQLSNNTHLIVDETKLTAGKLNPAGRKNYQAISDLALLQKVTYDFTYYTMEYETDIPLLILSGTKSFIPCMVQVPLAIDPNIENIYPQICEAAENLLKDENRVNEMRQYFECLKKLDFHIEEEITSTVQEDFVELRQLDKTVNADNLHSLMVFARLMALSHGETSLTLNRWKDTFTKEVERLGRLKKPT